MVVSWKNKQGMNPPTILNPLPDEKNLDRSKLKQSTDDNFKFDENSRKFSKRVEKTVGKGEIARYEQFLLFPQFFFFFQKVSFPGVSKGVIVWEWVNSLPNDKMIDWSKSKHLQTTIQKWLKWQNLSLVWLKTLQEREKMLVIGIFSFSHTVFKGLHSHG